MSFQHINTVQDTWIQVIECRMAIFFHTSLTKQDLIVAYLVAYSCGLNIFQFPCVVESVHTTFHVPVISHTTFLQLQVYKIE